MSWSRTAELGAPLVDTKLGTLVRGGKEGWGMWIGGAPCWPASGTAVEGLRQAWSSTGARGPSGLVREGSEAPERD